MDMQAIPKFNTGYADVDGNIYYIYGGAIPKRNRDYDWQNPVSGNTSDTEWRGIIPNKELPSLLNPESGYFQNCNGAPWYTNITAGIKPEDYPGLFIAETELDLRSQISLKLLEYDKTISFDELKRYKWNSHIMLADRIKPFLVNAVLKHDNFKSDIDLLKAVRALNAWDNSLGRNSRGGMLFLIWWNIYKYETEKIFAVNWNEKNPLDTPYGIGDDTTAINALRKAVKEMESKYSSTTVPWGEIHKIKRGEIELPLSGGPGGLGTLRVIGYQIRQNNSFVGNSGDSFIMITELSSPIKSVSILPYGNSGDPNSPHYKDQMPLFSTENYKPVWFYKEDILKNMERRYHPGKEIH
jgi:acyl-homoserine-lactone acylase